MVTLAHTDTGSSRVTSCRFLQEMSAPERDKRAVPRARNVICFAFLPLLEERGLKLIARVLEGSYMLKQVELFWVKLSRVASSIRSRQWGASRPSSPINAVAGL